MDNAHAYANAVKMTDEHKDFILNCLCPAILREEGLAFSMEDWFHLLEPGHDLPVDGIDHSVPACGTVSCIGGTACALLFPEFSGYHRCMTITEIGLALGLDGDHSNGLFFEWQETGAYDEDDVGYNFHWPPSFQFDYDEARTPLAKAEIAVRLLHLVVKTEGRCLERNYVEGLDE